MLCLAAQNKKSVEFVILTFMILSLGMVGIHLSPHPLINKAIWTLQPRLATVLEQEV